MIDAEKFVTNLKVNLLRTNPFYGHVLQQLPIVYTTTEVPTMGVGKMNKNEITIKLFINTDYIEHIIELANRNEEKVVNHFTEILRHEVHHLVFQHLTLNLPDKQRETIACELSVNSYIDRNKLINEKDSNKSGVFPEDFNLESKLGVHEYYALLNDNKEFNEMRKNMETTIEISIGMGSKEQEELDNLAEEQEKESKKTSSGDYGNLDQKEKQEEISDKTQKIMDKLSENDDSNEDDNNNGNNGKSSKKGSKKQNKGLQKIIDDLKEARDLQNQSEEDLKNGKMKEASEKQHKASEKIKEANDKLKKENQSSNGNGNGKIKVTIDSHGKWKSVEGDEMTNAMVKDIIRQANETCKQMGNWGNIPGELKEAINDSYANDREIIPWEVVLKNFLASSSENVLDYTMKRKSKRYGTRPGTKKDDLLHVAIGIDTSGSIDNEMLQMFFNELHWIEKTGTKITVFEWDTQVNREYDFKEYDGNITGRGGTDPTDFLEKVSERKFDCVITFTDLCFAPIEKIYNIPMLWVVSNYYNYFGNEYDYPVEEGIIMEVNESKDGFNVVRR